ncbi:MAG: 3-oxoacyl-ACP reductase FabG [Deltaproteobacteria bacterium]|nr:3-oxoacyl-ACP reductase FabG [Deltaproteobacteria bacterium]
MAERFKDRVALVTGASRGIGRAVAVAFAREGASVALCYTSNDGAAEAALGDVRAAGGNGELLKFDVADSAAVAAAVAGFVKARGRLDVVVNSAGIALDGLLLRQSDDDWARQLAVNLTGVMAVSREAAKAMLRARYGRIVNLTSVVGEAGSAGQGAYAATKAGIVGFTKSLAREVASRNISVNAVSPGFIDTDMTARLSAEQKDAILKSVPISRMGTVADVVPAVLYLASDEASYVTGQVIRVNGGLYM